MQSSQEITKFGSLMEIFTVLSQENVKQLFLKPEGKVFSHSFEGTHLDSGEEDNAIVTKKHILI